MMKRFSIICLIFVLVASLSLFGCDKVSSKIEDNTNLLSDYDSLVKEYTNKTIKNDLALPTSTDNGTVISWKSSDTSVVLDNGNLADITNGGLDSAGNLKTATLTATLSNPDTSLTKSYSFDVEVNKTTNDGQTIRQAKAAIVNEYEGKELTGYNLSKIDSNGAVYTISFAIREDVTLTYLDSDRIKFNGNVATITRPSESECIEGKNYVVETLKVKMELNDVSITFDVSLQITKKDEIMTVSKLREVMNSSTYVQKQDTYVFSGTVSMVYESETSKQGFFVQDENGAILVYYASISDACAKVSVGDEVLVTATTCFYSGLAETSSVSAIQIVTPASENTSKYNALERITVTKDNFNDETLIGKDNYLATVSGLIFDHLTDSSGNTITEAKSGTSTIAYFYFKDEITKSTKKEVMLSIDKYTSNYTDICDELNSLVFGDIINISECAISWHTNCELRLSNPEKLTKDTTITLTDKEKYYLDKMSKDALALNAIYAVGSYELVTVLPFGTTVEWSVKEDTDSHITINSKETLVITDFSDPIDFTLVAQLLFNGELGTKYEFSSSAVNPITLTKAKEQLDNGESLKANTVVTGKVVDFVGDSKCVITDGTTLFLMNIDENVDITLGSECILKLSTGSKENGLYKATIDSVITSTDGYNTLEATLVELSQLTNEFKKVEIKEVTIANGKAQVNDTVSVEFYNINKLNEAFADGTYKHLKGYTLKKDDNTILFYTIGVVSDNNQLVINPSSLLGYTDTSIAYATARTSIDNVSLVYDQIACYGTGLQWRVSGGIASAIYNIEALNQNITSIDLVWNSSKSVFTNDVPVIKILIGDDPTFASGTYTEIEFETAADQYEYTVNITATGKYFKIIQNKSHTYSMYWSSITLNFAD